MKQSCKILFFFVLFFGGIASAQNNPVDTNTYVILKNDSNEYIGKILSDDGREVLINTDKLGKIFIPKSDIKSILLINRQKDLINDEYRERGVFTTRYQFSTNSFPIEKGENYAMVNFYGPEVHFAVTNRFSIGVMASWIASPLVLAMKYTIPTQNEKLNFGFGTLMGTSGYLNQGKSFGGLHWAMMTYGDRKNNITFSMGYSYIKLGMTDNFQVFQEPGIYDANFDAWGNPTFNYNIPTYTITSLKSNITTAPIFGVAGITSVGKKTSFICDAMLLFGKTNSVDYYQPYPNYVYDAQNQPDYTEVYGVQKIEATNRSVNLILMPGMRFQKSETKAFQVSLAGIIGKRQFTDFNGLSAVSSYSFPIPMCSWFYKF